MIYDLQKTKIVIQKGVEKMSNPAQKKVDLLLRIARIRHDRSPKEESFDPYNYWKPYERRDYEKNYFLLAIDKIVGIKKGGDFQC